jgi:hypothetical protein
VLGADVVLLGALDGAIRDAEHELEEVLPHTPAGILTSIPRVAVVRASNYGGALGDPRRFRTAAQVYRMAGLVPRQYESAGRRRERTTISREGKAELREAIIELGRGLRQGHPDFARYAGELEARGKRPGIVACALGHRANRVAFAMGARPDPVRPRALEVAIDEGRARHGRANSTRSTSPARDKLDIARRRSSAGQGAGTGSDVDPARKPRGLRL